MRKKKQQPIFSNLEELDPEAVQKEEIEETDAKVALEKREDSSSGDREFPIEKERDEGTEEKPEDFLQSLASSFVPIPAGAFLMGSPAHEPGRNHDEVQHEITLTTGFYLQVTPVTCRQWITVMEFNPSLFPVKDDESPIQGISWQDCQSFIRKLNDIQEYRYRLPTEAEWEYACRAGSTSAFCNGEITELLCGFDPNLDSVGWYCGNSSRTIHPVGLKNPNGWGLYDMHGHLWEWCQDWYGEYSTSPRVDPRGADSGPGRVIRGGSWFSSAKNCRSACRFHWPPQSGGDFIGFRLVRDTDHDRAD